VKYVRELMTESNYAKLVKLSSWCTDHGRALNELAQAWLLAQPQVCSVITGARKLDQLLTNITAGDWRLSAGDLGEIEVLFKS
jgi:aryl-alcohol dehydrogenase-like predicted oxidoreductase